MSPKEAAEKSGQHIQRIYNAIWSVKLRVTDISDDLRTRWDISDSDLNEYLEECEKIKYVRANCQYKNGSGWYSDGVLMGRNIPSAYARLVEGGE